MPNSALSDLSDILSPIRQLARRMSISEVDAECADEELLRHALHAMGVPSHTDKEIHASLYDSQDEFPILQPVVVLRAGTSTAQVPFRNPGSENAIVEWELCFEDGTLMGGQEPLSDISVDRSGQLSLTLPFALEIGYYSFRLRLRAGTEISCGTSLLLVAPDLFYVPKALSERRVWGLSVPLTRVTSRRNWGCGEIFDLHELLEILRERGGDLLSLPPLHPMVHGERLDPFAPSSRYAVDPVYISIPSVEDFCECPEVQTALAADEERFRRSGSISRSVEDIARLKKRYLGMLFDSFEKRHLKADTERAREFQDYCTRNKARLQWHALYECLQEDLGDREGQGFREWPARYQDALSTEVREYAEQNASRIALQYYCQWVAERQLEFVGLHSLDRRLAVGLGMDLPLAAHANGSEIWGHRDLFARRVRLASDSSGKTATERVVMIPAKLRARRYLPFIELIRFNMKNFGMLSLEDLDSLFQQRWVMIDHGGSVSVEQDTAELLAIMKIESHRNQCMVVAGSEPAHDSARETLRLHGLFFNSTFIESALKGTIPKPSGYPSRCIVRMGKFDLPTLEGFWEGRDIRLRYTRRQSQAAEELLRESEARVMVRQDMIAALDHLGLLPGALPTEAARLPFLSEDIVASLYRYLSSSPARVLTVALEDVLAQSDQTHLPGCKGYPSWTQPLMVPLEELRGLKRFQILASALEQRGGRAPG